jgi:hypothetical protein
MSLDGSHPDGRWGQKAYLEAHTRWVRVICPRIGRKGRGRPTRAGRRAMFALYTGVNFANPAGDADERDVVPPDSDRNVTNERRPHPCIGDMLTHVTNWVPGLRQRLPHSGIRKATAPQPVPRLRLRTPAVRFDGRLQMARLHTDIHSDVIHLRPSFFPAASSAIDSRMRFSRVSGRLAV